VGLELEILASNSAFGNVACPLTTVLDEGVLFVGKAQEKASVFGTERRRDATGQT
jgi:hypothetical protein